MSFLRAEWRKLAMINYRVDPSVLLPFLPAGTELELWEDHCYVSIVGFNFLNTRVKGIKVPFHVNFEEVNLRFYVKRTVGNEERSGVVFIQEIVSKPLLAWVANTVYNENYVRHPMHHHWHITPVEQRISYGWKCRGRWNNLEVHADTKALDVEPNSEVEFITEHYWGYARKNDTTSVEYEVTHPRWQHYLVKNYTVDIDFGATYGAHFAFLNTAQANSVFLAEGSTISVEPAGTIKTVS